MTKQKDKKPDQIVFDEETQRYDAAIKEYGTNVGAPAISTTNVKTWKNVGISKVNHLLTTKFKAIQEEYEKLLEEHKWNDIIYNTEYNFEPIVGEIYHLYRREDDTTFLSVISPETFKHDFIGSFHLTFEQVWKKVSENPEAED
ncbi:MAG: DUF2452 domain-containing protein [Flavobacteriales bacterium]